jgi:hypothetical protein
VADHAVTIHNSQADCKDSGMTQSERRNDPSGSLQRRGTMAGRRMRMKKTALTQRRRRHKPGPSARTVNRLPCFVSIAIVS